MRFEVLHGSFPWDGKKVKKGDVVVSASRLDKRFVHKFRLVAEPEGVGEGRKINPPPSDGGGALPVATQPAGTAVTGARKKV